MAIGALKNAKKGFDRPVTVRSNWFSLLFATKAYPRVAYVDREASSPSYWRLARKPKVDWVWDWVWGLGLGLGLGGPWVTQAWPPKGHPSATQGRRLR